MNSIVEFLKENKEWLVPIIIAALTAIVAGIFQLFRKSGKTHKQKLGNINNSHVINTNGDVNHKQKSK